MNTQNTNDPSRKPVFNTPEGSSPRVVLWRNDRTIDQRVPVMTGYVDDQRVQVHLYANGRTRVMDIQTGSHKDGSLRDLARASVVAGNRGFAKLLVNFPDRDVWVNSTRAADDDFLMGLGLNIRAMQAKQAHAKIREEQSNEELNHPRFTGP